MKSEKAISIIKQHLTKKRFDHTLRVAETAVDLAELYGESQEKAELAAIFHDYAKFRSTEELRRWIIKSSLPKDLLQYHHELWHGPVGAILIEQEHGIIDYEVQGAIQCHTTGKANMSNLEKILFVADYIEPGRDFPGITETRLAAKRDLDEAAWMVSRNTIQFLMKKNQFVYPDTFHTYNDLTEQLKKIDKQK